MCKRSGGIASPFFNLSQNGPESKFHVLAALPPGKQPQVPMTGGCVGPRASPNIMEIKISSPCRELNPSFIL
jgi:hypothetical protein